MSDMTEKFDNLKSRLSHVEKIRPAKGCKVSYQCRCPAHKDDKPSLTLSLSNDDKILLHDHGNCRTEDILHALGLDWGDISPNGTRLSCFDRLCSYYAKKHGEGVKCTAEYPYHDENGRYLYSKLRFEGGNIKGKLIRYGIVDRCQDKIELCKKDSAAKVLYRLPEFQKLKHKSRFVYIVEGEKDCETLRKLGNGFGCATTAGGASDWRPEFARFFKGLDVVILRDNDDPGEKLADSITMDLRNYAHFVKVVCPSSLKHGDVTDYLIKEGGTAQSLKEMCASVGGEFAHWIKTDDNGRESGIMSGILADCISQNEQYIIVRNPKDDKDMFYSYEAGVYNRKNKAEIKAMIREYIPAAKVTDNMLNNVCNLLYATTDHVAGIEALNTDRRFINFRNGLYHIDKKTLLPHDPEILSTIQFPYNYDPDNNEHPIFDKYITDLCTKSDGTIDAEEIKIIQEYLGFLISNEPMQKLKCALVLWSRLGNSGKSVLIRLVSSLFGLDRVASIKLTELTIDNRFILGTLPECRLIVCGDESNTNVKDSSIFKSLTGGDPVKIEPKSKQGYSYIYTGGFMIACNGLPCFTDDKGEHLFNRLLILPCEHHISEEKKDAELDSKLRREIPAIFNWMIEGLNRLIENRYIFTKSKSSIASSEEYRMQMDNVYRFVTENYVITHDYNDRIAKKDFDEAYYKWAITDNSLKRVEPKNLPARLEMMGVMIDKGNVSDRHHITVYRGIKKRTEDLHEITEEEAAVIPYKEERTAAAVTHKEDPATESPAARTRQQTVFVENIVFKAYQERLHLEDVNAVFRALSNDDTLQDQFAGDIQKIREMSSGNFVTPEEAETLQKQFS